jgi:hypothetical protein
MAGQFRWAHFPLAQPVELLRCGEVVKFEHDLSLRLDKRFVT